MNIVINLNVENKEFEVNKLLKLFKIYNIKNEYVGDEIYNEEFNTCLVAFEYSNYQMYMSTYDNIFGILNYDTIKQGYRICNFNEFEIIIFEKRGKLIMNKLNLI